jgi:hypothetical protein
MSWMTTKLNQTAMNQSKLAEIEYRVREKFLLIESLAQDFKEMEELGLMTPSQFESYLEQWHFNREMMEVFLIMQSVHEDLQDLIPPVLLMVHNGLFEFGNLDRDQRRELAAALDLNQPLTNEAVKQAKKNLFPFQCLSL